MPDTTVRAGFECCQDGGYRTSRCPYCRYTMERPPCVVVTGRTAQDVEKALALLDRDRTGKAWLDAPYLETVRA